MTVVVWTQEIERRYGGCCIRVAVAQRQCYFNLTEKRKHVARRCGHGSVFSLSEERVKGVVNIVRTRVSSIKLKSNNSTETCKFRTISTYFTASLCLKKITFRKDATFGLAIKNVLLQSFKIHVIQISDSNFLVEE